MKLAEALMERADRNRRLQELRERIVRNAKHQEGEEPAEDPEELLEEYQAVSAEFERLVVRINKTNNQVALEDGRLMVEALSRREVLKSRHALYKALAAEATPRQDRYSQKEIKFVSAVDIKEIQTQADQLAKEYRELDTLIQQANWSSELI